MRTRFSVIIAAAVSIASLAACTDRPAPLAPSTPVQPNLNFGGGGTGGLPHIPGPNDITIGM